MRLRDPMKYAAAAFILLITPLLVVGQHPGEKLRGVIVDQMNARVARAKVLIVSGSHRREVFSNEMGEFSVEVPSGTYQITICQPRFSGRQAEQSPSAIRSCQRNQSCSEGNAGEIWQVSQRSILSVALAVIEPAHNKPLQLTRWHDVS